MLIKVSFDFQLINKKNFLCLQELINFVLLLMQFVLDSSSNKAHVIVPGLDFPYLIFSKLICSCLNFFICMFILKVQLLVYTEGSFCHLIC